MMILRSPELLRELIFSKITQKSILRDFERILMIFGPYKLGFPLYMPAGAFFPLKKSGFPSYMPAGAFFSSKSPDFPCTCPQGPFFPQKVRISLVHARRGLFFLKKYGFPLYMPAGAFFFLKKSGFPRGQRFCLDGPARQAVCNRIAYCAAVRVCRSAMILPMFPRMKQVCNELWNKRYNKHMGTNTQAPE